jgi:hypothetical protein
MLLTPYIGDDAVTPSASATSKLEAMIYFSGASKRIQGKDADAGRSTTMRRF